MKKIFTLIAIILATCCTDIFAQPRSISAQPDPETQRLKELAEKFRLRDLQRRAELERVAKEQGWTIRKETESGVTEIQFIDRFGIPQAYRTTNLNAGRTTNTDDIWVGGSTGLNLTGNGYIVGEWDGGGVLTTHQEFNAGSGSRVTQKDTPGSTHYHSTHVAGTIIAEGQVAAAHGMATEALLHAYDWNDDNSEMTTAAAGGLTLSNHSYGWLRGWDSDAGTWYWYGTPSISSTEDYLFGFYDETAQDWDEIAYNAPNYLIVKSSGNDRNDDHSGGHYVRSGGSWVWSTAARDQDGGTDGYDCIDQHGVPKNILTIGAVNDIPGGWTSPADVVQSSFSSWGPTDDGRIKPDLVANGVQLYSTTNTGNSDYLTIDGTSMSTPNVTGTLVLLQDYYQTMRGGTMSSAAIKGLVINTANEAGANDGPDYQNGWGLLNASGAANLITQDNADGGLILQATLVNGQTTDYTYYSNGLSPIRVTLCWTDPAGTPPAASLNPTTLMLVNDLDIRLIRRTSTYMPWVLNPAVPGNAAVKADNSRDNVERIDINSPGAGFYTIRINHSGVLSGGSQAYALIINGLRTPGDVNYCAARTLNWGSFEYIKNVTMGSINHTSGRSPGGYMDYTGLVNQIVKGTSETLSVNINGYSSSELKAWVDWNQDGDFNDTGESYSLGTGAGPTFSHSISAPSTARSGYTTMRVQLRYGIPTACGTITYGETEDYTLDVAYACAASGGCDEYISRVQAGAIDNSSVCSHYADYSVTHVASLPANSSLPVTITNGNGYSADQCGIWVDWNRNGSFYDANEQITVTGTPGSGPYTATLSPPAGQTLGNCIMRVRITYTGAVDPCGATNYGEVEDYKINITAKVPNVWTGIFNSYWGNGQNWSLGHVPTADEDVIIPNVNMPCIVDYSAKNCNNITTETGTTLQINANTLTVYGNMNISGQLQMTHTSAVLTVYGDMNWNSGSTASTTTTNLMWIHGNWSFNSGSNVQLTLGNVNFSGSDTKYIRSYTDNSAFSNLGSYKTGGAILGISSWSTHNLTISGSLYIHTTGIFGHYSSHNMILKGSIQNNNHYHFDYGTLVMDGSNQSIKPNIGDYLNNLTIDPSGTTTFDHSLSDTLVINGNLLISSGIFNPAGQTILIRGDWTNTVGSSGFTEGSSRVIFDGSAHQYVLSNETFNILESNMGAALRVNEAGRTVLCNSYDWKTGGIDVISGTFTAHDLAQPTISGGFWLNPGGTINLYNSDGYVDLSGNLNIYGGEFNVYGGSSVSSWWPFMGNASITMSGGILDFKQVGIYIYNNPSYTLTENITGGIIRTPNSFLSVNPSFTPSGGTVELYGSVNASLYTSGGSNIHNLLVSKVASDYPGVPVNPVTFDRETNTQTDMPIDNTVTLSGNADINGNLTILDGSLSAGNYTIYLAGNWDNQVGAGGFSAGTGTVEFDGAAAADINSSETFYNLRLNKTYAGSDGLDVNQLINIGNNLTIMDGTMNLNAPANLNVTGNLEIALNAGLNANDSYAPIIAIGGNWTNSNTTFSSTAGFNYGNSIVRFNGTVNQFLTTAATSERFRTLTIDKSAGKFRSNNNITCSGDINITRGNWEDNVIGLNHSVYGNFTVAATGGMLNAIPLNTITFLGSSNSNITYNSATGYLCNLFINKSTGVRVNQNSTLNCRQNGNLTIENGIYGVNGQSLLVHGDLIIQDLGGLDLQPGSILTMTSGNSITVNSGGVIDLIGSAASKVTVMSDVSTDKYNFTVNSGGNIQARYVNFRDMGLNGINLTNGCSIYGTDCLIGCTFSEGATGGTLLTINNNQNLTIRNAEFPTNTWGGNSNVTKSINTGTVYFVDFSGGFSGEAFDSDPFNRLNWVPTLTATATATPSSICSGSTTQLNVTQTGGLGPFTYLWSPTTGLSDPGIVNPVATPASTISYYVIVTDALGSTVSSGVGITVLPTLPASVSIVASANPTPPGNYVTFTATPVNGGASPAYQWKVNGVNAGTGLSTFSYVPSYNDQVTCVMTSSYGCPSGSPATSNAITMIVVVTNNTVTGNIPSPLSLCFDASNTITVAGGGTTFTVNSGASAIMIAGMKILYLEGTTVQSGGYMHGYITSVNAYCGSLPPAMVAVAAETGLSQNESEPRFTIWPNPTTGTFTLAQLDESGTGIVHVDIFGMRGEKLISTRMLNEKQHLFTITDVPQGIYFVRVVKGTRTETFKLILTR